MRRNDYQINRKFKKMQEMYKNKNKILDILRKTIYN